MSPMVAKCDVCGVVAPKNAASSPITSTKDKLTVRIEVVKATGSEPIVCTRCVKIAAYHGNGG